MSRQSVYNTEEGKVIHPGRRELLYLLEQLILSYVLENIHHKSTEIAKNSKKCETSGSIVVNKVKELNKENSDNIRHKYE